MLFTAPDPAAEHEGIGCWNGGQLEEVEGPKDAPQLYLRVDGATTLDVSEPDPQVKEAGHVPLLYPAAYMGASEDGMEVFFLTKTWMTENHPNVHDLELYEWQAEGAGTCTESSPTYNVASQGCLTRTSLAESATEAAEVSFVPTVSADGSTVYFTAYSDLAPGGNAYTPVNHGANGLVNIYRYHAGSVSYVAAVDNLDTEHPAKCGNRLGFNSVPDLDVKRVRARA